jgi:hypothetical protein
MYLLGRRDFGDGGAAECSDAVLGYIGALENTQFPGNAESPDGLGYRLGDAVSGVSLDRCGELCT